LPDRPFAIFRDWCGAQQVVIDALRGEGNLLCADLLHNVGCSLSPTIAGR